ncbi:RagB/SusD family nutrient uptake outer membrane protein [Carboxylicivirga taeanensis]|uniref:RagB/SusD family nutrient uptake outer membrane protein n=1 Tax=Carboxylicivirga taeanensis TaxID=1416875 RepID=UPI003F6E2B98
MRIHNYKILGALLAILFGSCTSWLDVDLVDQVTEEELFSKKEGFYEALAGVYSDMASSSMYGQNLTYETFGVLAQEYDFQGMENHYPSLRLYDYEDVGVKGKISGIWSSGYAVISAANNIIRHAEENAVLDEKDKNQVIGEALAIRAFMHFDLVRMFCPDVKLHPTEDGIPYNKEFGVAIPPMYTVEECIELVKNDLLEAEIALAASDDIINTVPYELETKDEADKYVARMNYYAVQGLLAKVYLAKGDFKRAREYAEKVITSEKFRLVNNQESIEVPEADLDVLFSDEHLFSLRNYKIPDYSAALHLNVVTPTSTSMAKLRMPGYLYGIYDGNNDDIRLNNWYSMDKQYLMKYLKENRETFSPKVPLLKLAEMYFIAAEGWWHVDKSKSMTYINELRDSRIVNNSHWNYITEDDLLAEMRREFIGEGQLFFIYKRLNHAILRETADGNVPASNEIFVFPMPESEIENGHR